MAEYKTFSFQTAFQKLIVYLNKQEIGKRLNRHQLTIDLGPTVNLSLLPNYVFRLQSQGYLKTISTGIYERLRDIPLDTKLSEKKHDDV